MARKGIPQEVRYSRNYAWTRPFRVSCDEYDRETWVFTIPVLGSLVWHRSKLCWVDLQCMIWNLSQPNHPSSWLVMDARARTRLWDMWERGIRATGKR